LALLGVRVFLVISGFLISSILFAEARSSGTVELDRFYFRRTMRIFVPYYAFLAVVMVLGRLGILTLSASALLHAATYTSNYSASMPWQLSHTWSLSVEEQFYLLWPALIVLLERSRALVVAALVVLAVPLVRVILWQLSPTATGGIGHRFETCADALAIGCLLAGVRDWLATRPRYLAATRSPALLVLVGRSSLAR
jgi:peptidoglycan/LPS O-acetylase OafA/YrhL